MNLDIKALRLLHLSVAIDNKLLYMIISIETFEQILDNCSKICNEKYCYG